MDAGWPIPGDHLRDVPADNRFLTRGNCELRIANCEFTARKSEIRNPKPAISVGMTLVELLVAMAILVTVTTSAMLIFRGITRAWRTGELRTERYQQARLLLDLFGRELSSSMESPRYPLVGTKAADPVRLIEGSALDELFFVGTLPGRTGLVERGYWVTADNELMCHDEEPADGDYASGMSEVCGRDVTAFEITYFDGSDWLDRWDGRPGADQTGALP